MKSAPRRWSLSAGIVAGLLAMMALPRAAEAHLVTTGLGPVYDGITHLLLSPEDIIPVVALALLAGLRGPAAGRWTLFLLPVAWLLGGITGIYARVVITFPIPAVSLLVLGILVASDLRLPTAAVAALAVALGFAHGAINGSRFQPPATGILALLGMTVLLFVVVAIFAAFVVSLRRAWTRIVVRVGGSWIAAIGLLMLGWAIHGAGPIH